MFIDVLRMCLDDRIAFGVERQQAQVLAFAPGDRAELARDSNRVQAFAGNRCGRMNRLPVEPLVALDLIPGHSSNFVQRRE